MGSLKDLRMKSQLSNVKSIIDKSKKVAKSKTTVRKAGSSYERLQTVCDLVEKRLGHLASEFELIQTEQRLAEYIDTCIKTGYLSLDTETTGLDPITDEIVGACIYTPGEKPAYVPINHISNISRERLNNQLTNAQVRNQLQRIVDNNVKVIYFNAKFDIRVCRHQLQIDIPAYWDGFIAGKVLKEDEVEGNLKYLWKKYCSPDKDAPHFTFDKMFQGFCFNIVPLKVAYLYAAKDAIMTWELFKFQEPYLTEDNPRCIECGFTKLAKLYREIEMPIIPIISDIEDAGVEIDVPYCEKLSVYYHKLLDEKVEAFNTALEPYKDKITQYMVTHPTTKLQNPINISSSTQLAELFYDILQLQPVSRKQPRGTGEEILTKLDHPLCKPILEYRGVNKLITTYIDKMPEIRNKKTGRIHCNFAQYGASTGRFSSKDPNLQNIPSHNLHIRPLFVASNKADVQEQDNTLTLLSRDIIKVNGLDVRADMLQVGDIIVSKEQKRFKIISITNEGNNFILTLEEVKL